jgi:hypothetical protein
MERSTWRVEWKGRMPLRFVRSSRNAMSPSVCARAWRSACLCALVALCGMVGCGGGGSTAHLQGTVTINNQPVPGDAIGSVTFQTTKGGQGKTATAPLNAGKYDVAEAPLGDLRVIITVQQPTGRTIDNGRGTPAQETKNIISDQYGSGIDVKVDGDDDSLNFDLKGI